ncbi:MAG: hypothetical protein LBV32_02455 [Tannerellaceae bacterium]|jgi:hypothetical protein|nr:hypothetical protein [Tannerellaceae bacterium]
MEREEDIFRQFRDSFNNLEGHFHILEHPVPVNRQMEYFKHSAKLRKNSSVSIAEEEIDGIFRSLEMPEVSEEEKKYSLSMLAGSKSVKAHRMLEEYVKHPDERLADWANMALMESRISLESEFSNEKQIYISTGLGGKNEKLRFFTLFVSKDKLPFKDYQRRVIDREFPYLLSHENCEIERMTVKDYHVEMLFLVPVRSDIKKILDGVIGECNQYGGFLSEMFTITNVKELTESEVEEIMNRDGDY